MKNEPAFPFEQVEAITTNGQEIVKNHLGLTKREYFAGLAMQGLAARGNSSMSMEGRIERAVDYADALLAELESETIITKMEE